MVGMSVGGLGSCGSRSAANIGRSADRIGPVRKRRWYRGSGRPVGPKLVAGRGLNRRRADITAPFRWATYLTLALGVFYTTFKLLLGG